MKDRLLSLAQVMQMTGLSEAQLAGLVRAGKFMRPDPPRWRQSAVQSWMEDHQGTQAKLDAIRQAQAIRRGGGRYH